MHLEGHRRSLRSRRGCGIDVDNTHMQDSQKERKKD